MFRTTQQTIEDPVIGELAAAVLAACLRGARAVASAPTPKMHPRTLAAAAECALAREVTDEERGLIATLSVLVLEQWKPGAEARLNVPDILAAHRARGGRMRVHTQKETGR